MTLSTVIDANIAVFSVLHTQHSFLSAKVLQNLAQNGVQLYAPGLWWYEVTSVIHRYLFSGLISGPQAYNALGILTADMGVQPANVPMRSAFDWATRLNQKAAYDGFYLAAAENLGAELWTADQALCNNVRRIGITWIHWIGEMA